MTCRLRFLITRVFICALLGFCLHAAISAWLAFATKTAAFEAAALGRERMKNEELDFPDEQDAIARRLFTGRLWISGFFTARGIDIVTSHDNGPPVLEIVEYRAGWPYRSWHAVSDRTAPQGKTWNVHGGLNTQRTIDLTYGTLAGLGVPRKTAVPAVIPWQPIWPELLGNVGWMTVAIAVLWFVPWIVRRTFRTWRGQCPACAYPIGSSTQCTECGRPVKPCPAAP